MSLEKDLEIRVEEVLHSDTVTKAQQIMGSRSGVAMVAVISFVESSLPLPILTDPFLVAAVLANRANVVKLIIITTIASAAGGLAAYLMATLFIETLLHWMTPGIVEQFQAMVISNGGSTFVLTLVGAVTPVPYTIVAWVVAVIKGGLGAFIAASILGRGVRYTIVGYSTYHFGPLAVSYAKKYIGITSVIVFILAAIFIWYKM